MSGRATGYVPFGERRDLARAAELADHAEAILDNLEEDELSSREELELDVLVAILHALLYLGERA